MKLFYLIAGLVVASTVFGLCAVVCRLRKELDELNEKFCDVSSRLSAKAVCVENQIDVLVKRVDEIPVEDIVKNQKQEEQFFTGLQNIFNYGGEIPKLNVEAIRRE